MIVTKTLEQINIRLKNRNSAERKKKSNCARMLRLCSVMKMMAGAVLVRERLLKGWIEVYQALSAMRTEMATDGGFLEVSDIGPIDYGNGSVAPTSLVHAIEASGSDLMRFAA
jgi:hypothetical protein